MGLFGCHYRAELGSRDIERACLVSWFRHRARLTRGNARFPSQPGSRETWGEAISGGPGSPDAGVLLLMMVLIGD